MILWLRLYLLLPSLPLLLTLLRTLSFSRSCILLFLLAGFVLTTAHPLAVHTAVYVVSVVCLETLRACTSSLPYRTSSLPHVLFQVLMIRWYLHNPIASPSQLLSRWQACTRAYDSPIVSVLLVLSDGSVEGRKHAMGIAKKLSYLLPLPFSLWQSS
eukprot:2241059-Pleurochrysis_carterae.AAC.3